jgi:hypothetical protein
MQKFFSRKSKKPEQESKAGMHERVKGHATPWQRKSEIELELEPRKLMLMPIRALLSWVRLSAN